MLKTVDLEDKPSGRFGWVRRKEVTVTAFGFSKHADDCAAIDLIQVDVNLADRLQSMIDDLKLIADLTREKANDAARLLYVASGQVDYGRFAQAQTIIENVRAALGISGSPQSYAERVPF